MRKPYVPNAQMIIASWLRSRVAMESKDNHKCDHIYGSPGTDLIPGEQKKKTKDNDDEALSPEPRVTIENIFYFKMRNESSRSSASAYVTMCH